MELPYESDGGLELVRVARSGGELTIEVRGRKLRVRVTECARGRLGFFLDGRALSAAYARGERGLELWIDGRHHLVTTPAADAETWGAAVGAAVGDGRVLTPMPGKVVAVNVAVNDRVAAGQPLVVLESMKMQNDVVAPVAGIVTTVAHEVGDGVEFGDVLVVIEPEAPAGG